MVASPCGKQLGIATMPSRLGLLQRRPQADLAGPSEFMIIPRQWWLMPRRGHWNCRAAGCPAGFPPASGVSVRPTARIHRRARGRYRTARYLGMLVRDPSAASGILDSGLDRPSATGAWPCSTAAPHTRRARAVARPVPGRHGAAAGSPGALGGLTRGSAARTRLAEVSSACRQARPPGISDLQCRSLPVSPVGVLAPSRGRTADKRSKGLTAVPAIRPLTCTYLVAAAGFEPATSGL